LRNRTYYRPLPPPISRQISSPLPPPAISKSEWVQFCLACVAVVVIVFVVLTWRADPYTRMTPVCDAVPLHSPAVPKTNLCVSSERPNPRETNGVTHYTAPRVSTVVNGQSDTVHARDGMPTTVTPVLLFAYNRPRYLELTLKSLLSVMPPADSARLAKPDALSAENLFFNTDTHLTRARRRAIVKDRTLLTKLPSTWPIYISQQDNDEEVSKVIDRYVDGRRIFKIAYNFSDIVQGQTPPVGGWSSYDKIAHSYAFGLSYLFDKLFYPRVIVIEDDMEFAPDFFEYFAALAPVLESHPDKLLCVSAWNDLGQKWFSGNPKALSLTNVFPGLGWMLTRRLWAEELRAIWPKTTWDEFMRDPAVAKGRKCIIPEVNRVYTFGELGSSHGELFERYLRTIHLNTHFVPFRELFEKEQSSELLLPATNPDQFELGLLKSIFDGVFVNPMSIVNNTLGSSIFPPLLSAGSIQTLNENEMLPSIQASRLEATQYTHSGYTAATISDEDRAYVLTYRADRPQHRVNFFNALGIINSNRGSCSTLKKPGYTVRCSSRLQYSMAHASRWCGFRKCMPLPHIEKAIDSFMQRCKSFANENPTTPGRTSLREHLEEILGEEPELRCSNHETFSNIIRPLPFNVQIKLFDAVLHLSGQFKPATVSHRRLEVEQHEALKFLVEDTWECPSRVGRPRSSILGDVVRVRLPFDPSGATRDMSSKSRVIYVMSDDRYHLLARRYAALQLLKRKVVPAS